MIVTYPSSRLTNRVHTSADFAYNLAVSSALLAEAAGLSSCAGLASNQIGITDARVFIVGTRIYINPTVIACPQHHGVALKSEGCFSLPGGVYRARRSGCISINYTDEHGVLHTNIHISGFHAQVVQHEWDHLEGRLINRFESRDAQLAARHSWAEAAQTAPPVIAATFPGAVGIDLPEDVDDLDETSD